MRIVPRDLEDWRMKLDSTAELIGEFRAGRLVVLMDDEDRENEGDLVMPAAHVTAEKINFMARFGRGLICMPIVRERCSQLGLWLMVQENREAHRTKFTVSIDAADGISTGISASDRAATIRAAVAAEAKPSDFVQPGHVFPLVSEPGGVLTRAGHTEAGCDLARLAGLEPAAVLVEILNEDGTMARRPDLEKFAAEHQLKIGTIADLIEYRMLNEKTVARVAECSLPTEHGDFHLVSYKDTINNAVHFALVKGTLSEDDEPVLIRVHVHDALGDLTDGRLTGRGWPLANALERVAKEGKGVVIILHQEQSADELIHRIRHYHALQDGQELAGTESSEDLRTYGLGAQIVRDLGIRRMRVLSAPKKIHGLSGFGLEVVEYVN